MDDRARFEMAASVREAGDFGPFVRGGVEPVARLHVDLRDVVAVIAPQRINLAVEDRRAHMPARIGQIRFALPVFSPFKRQTPVLPGIGVAIGLVAAEVM